MAGPRVLLRRTPFRRLYLSRLATQTTDGIFEASLAGVVVFSPDHAASAGAIASGLAVTLLPFSVVAPAAGIVLDRVSRSRALVICALIRVGLLLLLGVEAHAHHHGADLYLTALLVFSVNRFVLSGLSSGLPLTVEADELVPANSLSTTSGTVATLVGAIIGAGIRGLAGNDDTASAVVAVTAAAGYGLAAFAASRLGRGELGPVVPRPWASARTELRQVLRDTADGARHLAEQRPALHALMAVTVARFGGGVVFVATLLVYRNLFHTDLKGLVPIGVATGLGTGLAALVTPRATRRTGKPRWIVLALALGAAAQAIASPYTKWSFVFGALVLGFASQAAKIALDTLIQESVADAFRGRAFSVYDLLFNVSYTSAAGVAALVLPMTGKSYAVIAALAAMYIVTATIYGLTRSAETDQAHDRAEQPAAAG
ncbi:MAG TPA: MFS transporter [Mycobacteriales bacterium]|nr:MFS transporter [Mycobacteriales bacterium]